MKALWVAGEQLFRDSTVLLYFFFLAWGIISVIIMSIVRVGVSQDQNASVIHLFSSIICCCSLRITISL